MTKLVYFLRHGVAYERDQWDGDNDELRPLTKAGKKAMKHEGKRLNKWKLSVDYIVTSPLVRAYETAQIVAKKMEMDFTVNDLLKPGFNHISLDELLTQYPHVENLLIVGHEPDFSRTISQVIGGGDVDMRKGGLACVELNSAQPVRGRLLALLTPKQLGA